MKTRILLLLTALGLAGCSHYSSVTEKRPAYRPITPVGKLIATAQEEEARDPQKALGRFLDAAAAAERELQSRPGDEQARTDYNFAVARIFEVIHDANLAPWNAPLQIPGTTGEWSVSFPKSPKADRNPDLYHLLPADRYTFKGTYVTERRVQPGVGAPLVVTNRKEVDPTKIDRFAQGNRIYYGVTGFVRFEGKRAIIGFVDPLSDDHVRLGSHRFPLAADYTAALALGLARENPKKLELLRLLRPGKYAETARIARLQPYDPAKIPILCVHGLMDSQATWAPLIQALRADPELRRKYQVWFYSYPSGYPFPYSASIMREQLDAFRAKYPGHKKIVLIGHSMGGCISRLMITDTGDKLWNELVNKSPEEIQLPPATKKLYTDAMIFKHRPEVSRVIFVAAPLKGSDLATNWVGRLGSKLVKSPITLLKAGQDGMKFVKLRADGLKLNRIPNSVDTLAPNNGFVRAIQTIPTAPGIPYHVISGDRGKGGNKDKTHPVMSDGIVPYWSSHMDGAQSELVVPSSHSAHQNPQAIAEIQRILKLHAR